MKLVQSKQLLYGGIYSLRLTKLETLKTYIEIPLKTRFILLSKSLAMAIVLFHKKSDDSFRLYIDYQCLNNLIIKNQYFLPLIGESLNRFG